jgi:hypothetical protein
MRRESEIVIFHQFGKIFGICPGIILDAEFSDRDKTVFLPGEMEDAPEKVMAGRLFDQQFFI